MTLLGIDFQKVRPRPSAADTHKILATIRVLNNSDLHNPDGIFIVVLLHVSLLTFHLFARANFWLGRFGHLLQFGLRIFV
jgi:hypothetical protein